MRDVESRDLQQFGMIPEFTGRFPTICALLPLSEADLVRVLTEPRDALTKQYARILEMEGVGLRFEPAALQRMASRAVKHGTGARGLRSILDKCLTPVLFDLPTMRMGEGPRVVGCYVTEKGLRDGTGPELVMDEGRWAEITGGEGGGGLP